MAGVSGELQPSLECCSGVGKQSGILNLGRDGPDYAVPVSAVCAVGGWTGTLGSRTGSSVPQHPPAEPRFWWPTLTPLGSPCRAGAVLQDKGPW